MSLWVAGVVCRGDKRTESDTGWNGEGGGGIRGEGRGGEQTEQAKEGQSANKGRVG